jgi:uncharacterized protein
MITELRSTMSDRDPLDQTPGERIRIPVNTENAEPEQPGVSSRADNLAAVDEVLDQQRSRDELSIDEMVRGYEQRYTGFRDGESDKVKRSAAGSFYTAPKPAPKPSHYRLSVGSGVSEEERMWAAIAHGSALLTLIVGLATGGLATLFTLFIPLGIYFAFRQRSPYVAYAALQAFALQVVGTIGWLVLVVAGALIGGLLIVLLAITVIGIPVAIIVALALALAVVVSLVLPLGMVVYGAIAAWETYQGRQYRYPWIANWIDRQMHGGFLATL